MDRPWQVGSLDDTDTGTQAEVVLLTGHTWGSCRWRFRLMDRPWQVAVMGRYGEVVGRGHRAGKGLPHRTYVFGSGRWRFRLMDRPWQVAVGRYGEVVGRGHRAGKGLPHRTYVLGLFGGVFASDGQTLASGSGTTARYDCGTWTQGRKRPLSQDIRLRSFGGVFAGWTDPGKWQLGRYGEVVGRGHRAGKGLPHRTYVERSIRSIR